MKIEPKCEHDFSEYNICEKCEAEQFECSKCGEVEHIHKLQSLESELSAARGEIERLEKQWIDVPDDYANWREVAEYFMELDTRKCAEFEKIMDERDELKKRVEDLVGACEFVGAMMYRSKSEFYDKIRMIINNPNWPQENGKD